MKIVFFGTPEFASEALERILNDGYEVCTVVTRADKPKGRGNNLASSPVKALALSRGIEVFQPATLRSDEVIGYLRSKNADLFITAAYGRIFPKEILEMPPLGCVNIHASLLPSLRGASPINRAIINGDTLGGVTVMYMDEGIDTGDIVLKKITEIPQEIYFDEYYKTLTSLGCDAISEFLSLLSSGAEIPRTPQDSTFASYADKIEKADEILDFSDTAENVYNKIRGLSPSPCTYTFLGNKRVKVFKALLSDSQGEEGKVLRADKNGIEIACRHGSVILTELQPENKSRMPASAFLAGNKIT